MASGRDFTIEAARRNRICEDTRRGYRSGINQVKAWARLVGNTNLLKTCEESKDKETINLEVFQYQDFLDFLVWTVNNKRVEVGTLNGYRSAIKNLYKDNQIPLPDGYGDDMKEIFSGFILFIFFD